MQFLLIKKFLPGSKGSPMCKKCLGTSWRQALEEKLSPFQLPMLNGHLLSVTDIISCARKGNTQSGTAFKMGKPHSAVTLLPTRSALGRHSTQSDPAPGQKSGPVIFQSPHPIKTLQSQGVLPRIIHRPIHRGRRHDSSEQKRRQLCSHTCQGI
jgi:hypothetical protein